MKRLSNKILLGGLIILAALFAASRFFRSPGLESNLRKELVKVDTASINEVKIIPAKEHMEELTLRREGTLWKVKKGDRIEPVNKTTLKSMLTSLAGVNAQRMVSRKKDKWNDFNVGDGSTHVSVYSDGSKIADFHVGKLGFTQSSDGGFGGAYTYVRVSDEDEVFTVEGFLESIFNNTFNDWRDKTLFSLDKSTITKISYRYPLDSGFVVEKKDSIWFVGTQELEPSKAENLLSQFTSKYLTEFADGFSPTNKADINIQVDGGAGSPTTIDLWKKDESEWIVTSSTQKGIYFSSKGSTLVTDLLIGKSKLVGR
jgi:hypothetical protein